MNYRLLFCAASALTILSGQAFAAQAPAPHVDSAADLGAVVVTATRTATALDKVGVSLSVLDLPRIERSQATGATDLLIQTPGVTFSRNGGAGKTTSIYIRGAETDQTVFLIDGVKLNDPSSTGGGFNAADMMVGDIARMEVLRGAQSTLWGSQAIGGVVNLITREPIKSLEGNLLVEGGSYKTGYARGALGGVMDRLKWRIGGGYYTTDGISAAAIGTEPDGYRNVTLNGRLNFEVTKTFSLDQRAYYTKGHSDIDSTSGDSPIVSDTEQFLSYSGANLDLFGGRLRNRLAYTYTDIKRTNDDPRQRNTTRTFDAEGENNRWEYQGSFAITEAYLLTFGGERERSTFRSASPSATNTNPTPARGRTGLTDVYGQLQADVLPGLTLTGGVRYNDHLIYGGHTLFQASGAYVFNNKNTVLRASYGEGFKAPSLFQLRSDFGNLNLTPEEAKSWDAGVEQRFWNGRIDLQATYFHRDSDNLIIFNSCSVGTRDPNCFNANGVSRSGFYANVARARAKGWELAASIHPIAHLNITVNYTALRAQDVSPGVATFSRYLVRRPKQAANLSVDYVWPFKLSTGFSVRRQGTTFNNATNTQKLKQYTLVDIRTSYPVTKHIEVYARVENLFEQTYQTILTYGSMGQASYAGVRIRY